MIWREAVRFGLVGVAQIGIDWVAFVGLTALGMPVFAANLVARMCGAGFGFVANAHFTFAQRRQEALDRRALARFVLLWLASTLVSTVAMSGAEHFWGLKAAWLLKPIVDGLLAGFTFFASRHWVYR